MIANALLRKRITIRPYDGPSSEGPSNYGTPFELPCRKVDRLTVSNAPDGSDLSSTTTVDVRPDPRIVLQSEAELDGDLFEVVDIAHVEELNRPHHDTLILAGPR